MTDLHMNTTQFATAISILYGERIEYQLVLPPLPS